MSDGESVASMIEQRGLVAIFCCLQNRSLGIFYVCSPVFWHGYIPFCKNMYMLPVSERVKVIFFTSCPAIDPGNNSQRQ